MAGEGIESLLSQVRAGDRGARDRLFAVLYEDLQARARFELRRGGRKSLDTTVIVHEAYLRLAKLERLVPDDKAHFMRIAARAMRSVVVDQARRRLAQKRGGGLEQVDLELAVAEEEFQSRATDLMALDEALSRLEQEDSRLAEVVQLRYFAGQSVADTAEALGVSERTVKRDWRMARAMLHAMLEDAVRARTETE
jgi:RNA polymerase sigma factor (TIGR02999 family)